MKKKVRVGVLFGGKSAEHEISLLSARNVVESIDRQKYDVVLIGVDKTGQWSLSDGAGLLEEANPDRLPALKEGSEAEGVTLVPTSGGGELLRTSDGGAAPPVDVIFPVMHGPFGEDGTVQGLLKLADIPFVGASVLGSAVAMDKDVMKRLLRDAGIPIPAFLAVTRSQRSDLSYSAVADQLGVPFFVKPANLGSSVGISKVHEEGEFLPAIADAFEYDDKILIEENILGREIECSVLGNEDPIASRIGEIIPKHEFYSYEAKYLDENGAILKIPAELPEDTVKEVQDVAIRSFKVLCCEGMARVDLFLTEKNEVVLNELNTIPGFTRISMYPKLWEASGMSYTELVDRLIQLAIDRYEREQKLKTSYDDEG